MVTSLVICAKVLLVVGVLWWWLRGRATPEFRRRLAWLPFVELAITYAAAAVSPRGEPFLLLVFLLPFARPGTRVDIACRYGLLMPLLPELTISLMAGSHLLAQLSPVHAYGFGALLAGWGARPGSAAPPLRWRGPELAVAALLVLVFGVALPRFGNAAELVHALLTMLLGLAVPLLLLLRSLRTRAEWLQLLGCLGASTVILAGLALYERHNGWALFDALGAHLQWGGGLSRSYSVRGGALRASVTAGNAVEFGVMMALGLLALLASRACWRRGNGFAALVALVVLGCLAAQSRGAVVALAAATVVVFAARRRWDLATGAVAAAGLGYGLLRLASGSSDRIAAFMGAGKSVGAYADYRTLLLTRGLEEGRAHRWFGASQAEITRRLADITQGEQIVDLVNSYLHIYLLAGLVGLGLVVGCLAAAGWRLVERLDRRRGDPAVAVATFCLAAYVVMLLSLATTNFFGRMPTLLAIVLAGGVVVAGTRPRAARPLEPAMAPPAPVPA